MSGLIGVPARHRGDEVRVHDAGLQEVEHAGVEGVAQPVVMKIVLGPSEIGGPQHALPVQTLVLEVVDCVTDALMRHPVKLVDLIEQDRHQPGGPAVAMNHIGTLVGLEHELERGPAEEREAHRVVRRAVQRAAFEEPVLRVRFDEKALASVHMAEPDGAVNGSLEPWHPEVAVIERQTPDVLVAQAVVLRKDDLHGMAADLQFAAEPEHHVAQSAGVRNGGALGSDHHDIHNDPSAKMNSRRQSSRRLLSKAATKKCRSLPASKSTTDSLRQQKIYTQLM